MAAEARVAEAANILPLSDVAEAAQENEEDSSGFVALAEETVLSPLLAAVSVLSLSVAEEITLESTDAGIACCCCC